MIFDSIFYTSVNINTTHSWDQRNFTDNQAIGQACTAFGAMGDARARQGKASTHAQRHPHGTTMHQLYLRWLGWPVDQRIMLRWAIGVEIANIAAIDETVLPT
jgi:hypothetical protein